MALEGDSAALAVAAATPVGSAAVAAATAVVALAAAMRAPHTADLRLPPSQPGYCYHTLSAGVSVDTALQRIVNRLGREAQDEIRRS